MDDRTGLYGSHASQDAKRGSHGRCTREAELVVTTLCAWSAVPVSSVRIMSDVVADIFCASVSLPGKGMQCRWCLLNCSCRSHDQYRTVCMGLRIAV